MESRVLYIGMKNTPVPVDYRVALDARYRIRIDATIGGRAVALRPWRDAPAYFPPYDNVVRCNASIPPMKNGELYSVYSLDCGFSGHDCELVYADTLEVIA